MSNSNVTLIIDKGLMTHQNKGQGYWGNDGLNINEYFLPSELMIMPAESDLV
ncbi:hypothetical protein [Bathymodiolus platifrons methanotrophic gill symbiont]|uniref:hypothetical protein n=1 Tax=Bathymodiolus platifrons methanotrophic gill symbiont TaxID=113268 RepID=UPI001C8DF741|nr:hypothetical protein [Bathymodiolus platifrons methanotrophic gill symbiont]